MEKYTFFERWKDQSFLTEDIKKKVEEFLLRYQGKSGDLHLHSGDRFDAENSPKDVVKKMKELGAIGFASTQHGVLSRVDDFIEAVSGTDLIYIPGIELYIDSGGRRSHLVLLGITYDGYLNICRAVTDCQDRDGYAVLTMDQLRSHFGPESGVLCLTGCIHGIPGSILLENSYLDREMQKLLSKKERVCPSSAEERIKEVGEKINAFEQAELTKAEQAELTRLKREEKKLLETAAKGAVYTEEIKMLLARKKSPEEAKEGARKSILLLQEIFGSGNLYVELQYHGMEEEKVVYPVLSDIAVEEGIPVVATNDVHILDSSKEELLRRNTLRALRFQKWEEIEESDKELYIKNDRELRDGLLKILPEEIAEEAVLNILVILARSDFRLPCESHFPKFHPPQGKTSDEYFDQLIEEGVRQRFPDGLSEVYKRRLDYEISVIRKCRYVDYHLIVQDFLNYGRELQRLPEKSIEDAPYDREALQAYIEKHADKVPAFYVGLGRGSGVGSLVCYILGITAMDPIKYNLIFERYLNLERVSMPDIDSDLAKTIREKVIRYIRYRYGNSAVCGIMTTNAQGPKSCIRMAAKYYALSQHQEANTYLSLAGQICKAVPADPGISFSDEIAGTTLFEYLCRMFPSGEAEDILHWAHSLEGSFTSYGAHAAGVVIGDGPLRDIIPLRYNSSLSEMTTQCNMVQTESLHGLLKMDCLGLRTLDVISETIRMVYGNHERSIDPLKLEPNDPKVFSEIFQKGRTNAVFQFESEGMKNMLRRFRPECFEDLIILVSTFRPGPMQYLDGIIEVKSGVREMRFLTPELEPILGETYGAIVYQEQVMEIFQKLAGYSLGGADQVRRAMSKKKIDKLVHERQAFIFGDPKRGIRGCVENGIEEAAADQLFSEMTDFARYAFNKSHACAYAMNSYITAWLKLYYPAEFLCAALNFAQNEKIPGLIREAKNFGINIHGPNINRSMARFSVSDGELFFGLSSVKSVGSAGDDILLERAENGMFKSIREFFIRTASSRSAVESLIRAGAFDDFNPSRSGMIQTIDLYKKCVKKLSDSERAIKAGDPQNTKKYQRLLIKRSDAEEDLRSIIIPPVPDDPLERLKEEHRLLGLFACHHPAELFIRTRSACPVSEMNSGTQVLQGVLISVEIKKRKSDGKEMAFAILDDGTGECRLSFFTRAFSFCRDLVQEGNVLTVYGSVMDADSEEDYMTFSVDRVTVPPRKKKKLQLEVQAFPLWHIRDEYQFRARYGGSDREFCVLDRASGEIREMKYRLSESAASAKGIREV